MVSEGTGAMYFTTEGLNKALARKIKGSYQTMSLFSRYGSELQSVADKYGYETIYDLINDANEFKSGMELYNRTSGEVESRNVQKRMNMTEEERRDSLAMDTEDTARENQIFLSEESGVSYSIVSDKKTLEKLEKEPTITVYRAMQLIDGKLYPPMSAKVGGKLREPILLNTWEQSEENPSIADDKGYFVLNKGNGKSLKARYNPYLHTSRTPLNDQFSEAQNRPNLVTVEVKVPTSELTSGYKAEKAKDAVGELEWKAGVVQSKLSGTRKVILSRWDKPVRIVPEGEVADVIVQMFDGKEITMPSNVVTPKLREELEKRGVPFIDTDNRGKPIEAINEKNGTRFRDEDLVEEANRRFNEQLSILNDKNADSVVLELGRPSGVLLSSGVADKPLKLYGNKVIKKMKKHGFSLPELKDLPRAVSEPIAVFDNLGRKGNRSILTELKTENGNFLVTIDLGKDGDIDFNIISSVFGKSGSHIVDWLIKGLASFIDKKKAQLFLSHQSAPIAATAANNELSSAAKIVNDFKNPTSEAGKIVSTVEALGESLGESVSIVRDINEIRDDNARREARKRGSKGWYDPETGEVVIVLPNTKSVADGMKTVLHEIVGHKGLRALKGKHFDKMLDDVYEKASENVRAAIDGRRASGKYKTTREATEEYIAALAEDGTKTLDEIKLWERLKREVRAMLVKAGINVEINDKDLRYMLWKSRKNLERNSLVSRAKDASMRHKLGIGKDSDGELQDVPMIGTKESEMRYSFSSSKEDFEAKQRAAVESKGIVASGLKDKSVSVVRVGKHNFKGSALDAIKQAKEEAKKTLSGVYSLYDGGEYEISKSAIDKYLSRSATGKSENIGVHLSALMNLPEIIKSSIDAELHADYKKGKDDTRGVDEGVNNAGVLVHRMYGAIDINGVIYRVKTTLKEFSDANRKNTPHSYEVTEIELLEASSKIGNDTRSRPLTMTSSNSISAANLLKGVEKSYEKGKYLLDESEKSGDGIRFRDDDAVSEGQEKSEEKSEALKVAEQYEEKIKKLKSKVRDKFASVEAIRKDVADYIRMQMDDRAMSSIFKSDLNSFLSLVIKAKTKKALKNYMTMVENISTTSRLRTAVKESTLLLSLKTQDQNGRNMSIAKNVDNTTRMIFEDMRRELKGFSESDFDAEIKENGRLIREINAKTKDMEDGAEKDALLAEKKNAQEDTRELKELKEEAKREHAKLGVEDVKRERTILDEKIEAHINGKGQWTAEDSARETGLAMRERELARIEMESDLKEVEKEMARLRDKRRVLRGGMRDGALHKEQTQAEIKALTLDIDALIEESTDLRKSLLSHVEGTNKLLRDMVSNGRESLHNKLRNEMERRKELVHNAIRDISTGKKIDENQKRDKANVFKEWATSPLRSFEYMCRTIGKRLYGEDSWFYRHFMLGKDGVIEAKNTMDIGKEHFRKVMEAQSRKIFDKDIEKVMGKADGKTESGVVSIIDKDERSDTYGERIDQPMNVGQAMYVYMVYKMSDGRNKLNRQGFDDKSMEQIEQFIGQNYKDMADYMQEELLPSLREKYNATYLSVNNTEMARIEHYVPLRINSNKIQDKTDLEESNAIGGALGHKVGSLINRTQNTLPVDITQNAFDVISDNVAQMEEWNAFVRVQKDLTYLIKSPAFRNTMNANSAGSFEAFKTAAMIATYSYSAGKPDATDKALSAAMRGLAGGAVAYRMNTAVKQLLSLPAFFGYSLNPKYYGLLAKSVGTFTKSYKWANENIPSFRERMYSGAMGDEKLGEETFGKFDKLQKKVLGWGMKPNRLVDAATCASGAKAVYDYSYGKSAEKLKQTLKQLERDGKKSEAEMREIEKKGKEEARRLAIAEATAMFNSTQQSQDGAFLSPIQKSRSFIAKAMTLFQNSNLGFQRQLMGGITDLYHSVHMKKMTEAYAKDYVAEGMSQDEAMSKARMTVLAGQAKSAAKIGLFGFALQMLWDAGSKGILGLFFTPDTDEEEESENTLYSYGIMPFRGNQAANMIEKMYNGYGTDPTMVFTDIDRFKSDFAAHSDAFGISYALASDCLELAGGMSGFNFETWTSIYLGAERLIKDGGDDADLAIMELLCVPMSSRVGYAKKKFANMSPLEYAQRISRVKKYVPMDALISRVPSMRQMNQKELMREYKEQYKNLMTTPGERAQATESKELKKEIATWKSYKNIAIDGQAVSVNEAAADKYVENHPRLKEYLQKNNLLKAQ